MSYFGAGCCNPTCESHCTGVSPLNTASCTVGSGEASNSFTFNFDARAEFGCSVSKTVCTVLDLESTNSESCMGSFASPAAPNIPCTGCCANGFTKRLWQLDMRYGTAVKRWQQLSIQITAGIIPVGTTDMVRAFVNYYVGFNEIWGWQVLGQTRRRELTYTCPDAVGTPSAGSWVNGGSDPSFDVKMPCTWQSLCGDQTGDSVQCVTNLTRSVIGSKDDVVCSGCHVVKTTFDQEDISNLIVYGQQSAGKDCSYTSPTCLPYPSNFSTGTEYVTNILGYGPSLLWQNLRSGRYIANQYGTHSYSYLSDAVHCASVRSSSPLRCYRGGDHGASDSALTLRSSYTATIGESGAYACGNLTSGSNFTVAVPTRSTTIPAYIDLTFGPAVGGGGGGD